MKTRFVISAFLICGLIVANAAQADEPAKDQNTANPAEQVLVLGQRPTPMPYTPLKTQDYEQLKSVFGGDQEYLGDMVNTALTFKAGLLKLSPKEIALGPIGVSPLGLLAGTIGQHGRGSSKLVPGYKIPTEPLQVKAGEIR
jgi:hypothetical protein